MMVFMVVKSKEVDSYLERQLDILLFTQVARV
jgi:hypothetical protein